MQHDLFLVLQMSPNSLTLTRHLIFDSNLPSWIVFDFQYVAQRMHTLFIPRVIWNLNPPKRHFYLQDVSLKMYLLGWDDNSVGTVLALQAESLNLIPEPMWKGWMWWRVLVISLLVRRRQADHRGLLATQSPRQAPGQWEWCLKKIDATWWPHTSMHRYTYLQTFEHICMYEHTTPIRLKYCFSWWHWGFYKLCRGEGSKFYHICALKLSLVGLSA